ncbi:hypothetical protein [Paenibacillus amylolyticus]|jgi:hypothetical protein
MSKTTEGNGTIAVHIGTEKRECTLTVKDIRMVKNDAIQATA